MKGGTIISNSVLPFRIFVGYDTRERVAYHVLTESILSRSSVPVTFTPLALSSLPNKVFDRARDPLQSTDFAFSRFLVPYLSGYTGWSLFVDCDFIFRRDIKELLDLRNEKYSVMCCKHSYVPRSDTKFLGQRQTIYPRKNWSSLILFNNARCTALTPAFVKEASGACLHQFAWLEDSFIGELPLSWNFLVGEYESERSEPIGLHYTLGGPYFEDCRDSPFASEWYSEFKSLLTPLPPGSRR